MQIKTAMILAAGEGQRMRPLTLTTPKPLLQVGGTPLIEHHIAKLAAAGVDKIVVNLAYLGEKIERALGDGSRFDVSLIYSYEPRPLETAGALYKALPLLGQDPFLLVNGDIFTDLDFSTLNASLISGVNKGEDALGMLILVPNPAHNPEGDFVLQSNGTLGPKGVQGYSGTFSGISMLSPALISKYPHCRERFALKEVFVDAIAKGTLRGQVYEGVWTDVGTPERLEEVNRRYGERHL